MHKLAVRLWRLGQWYRGWRATRRPPARRGRWRPLLEELEGRLTPSTTYCVDQVHGTPAGTGSATSPFSTINAANAKATAGDTVLVASGTYREMVTVQNSGTVGAPLTFAAAPGATVTVTGGTDGFVVSGKSYVVIQGFHVTGTAGVGIVLTGASHVSVLQNDVSFAGQPVSGKNTPGIRLNNTGASLIDGNTSHHNTDAGIQLTGSSTGDTVSHNVLYANARQFERAAPGIDVRAPGNVISFNVCHDNEDSGIQFYSTAAANNLAAGNVVYHNGDHGIDVLRAMGVRIVGNTVYGNLTAGINVEGGATGATVANNVSVNNGLNTSPRTKGDIRVDADSTAGTALDYNLVWSPAGNTLYVWGGNAYTTLSGFRTATRQDAHGIQADPKFVNAAAGDFHLLAGSPAIDSANAGAAGQPATDSDGRPRVDDPATPNTGAGPSPYYDRGAYEFQPGG